MNARSELVTPANFAGGGVLERTRRFHTASRGVHLPGAEADARIGIAELDRETAGAHAAAVNNASVSDRKVRLVDRDGRRA